MRNYDPENRADDDRNSVMSDLACDNDYLRKSLAEIREVYAGFDGFLARTTEEKYLLALCRETYLIARDALEKSK